MARVIRIAVAAALTVLAGPLAAQEYRGWSCAQLWRERNGIYRDAGYCFRTPRAIQAFGNAGCRFDSPGLLPLTPKQRAAVTEIIRLERQNGCAD